MTDLYKSWKMARNLLLQNFDTCPPYRRCEQATKGPISCAKKWIFVRLETCETYRDGVAAILTDHGAGIPKRVDWTAGCDSEDTNSLRDRCIREVAECYCGTQIDGQNMASAQQLIGLVKSHAEGDADRFFDLAMQLAAAEEQKGHRRLAEQLRQWAEAGQEAPKKNAAIPTPIATPRGDLGQILAAAYPETQLGDVILPPKLQDELTHIVVEARMREKLEEKGLKPRRRILLSGPPGTGKTLSASALAGELKYPLFTVMLHGLITKYMGETAQKLKLVFDAIKTTRGVYLFDEIDALAAARGAENDVGEARRVLNSFLQFLEEDTGPSLVVATTNAPEILDRAILRRFDLVLSYDLPGEAAVKRALERRLMGFNISRLSWPRIAQHSAGLSTADVVAAAEDAARRCVLADSERISTKELVEALDRRRSLQGLGAETNGQRASTLSPAKSRKSPPVSSKGRGRRKTSK